MKNLELKIPPAVVFIVCVGLIWAINYLLPSPFYISVSNWIVRTLLGLGVLMGVSGVIQFAIQSTSVNPHKPYHASSIVKTGVYRLSRNPMYLSMLIILLAAVLKIGHPLGFIILPFYVWYMNRFQIIPEEKVMEKKFGDAHRSYKRQVRRWI
ncbi:methyltransferase family protein [Rhodohalobacter sp. 8-1]|uniref:methyltransferase family protein n=1 Tax=Rhodohalobacter sp. 8-1 TaxID=3131972 RepID=UPI0030EDE1F5